MTPSKNNQFRMSSIRDEPELSNYKKLVVNNGPVSISLISCTRITNGVSMDVLDDALKNVTDEQWIEFVNTAAR